MYQYRSHDHIVSFYMRHFSLHYMLVKHAIFLVYNQGGWDKPPWLRNCQLTKAYVLGAYSLCAQVCVACKFLRWADGRQKCSLASQEGDEARHRALC